MKIKEYNLFATAKKTAVENNLVVAEKKTVKDTFRLFDFSAMDALCLPGKEAEYMKSEALSHVCSAFPDLYYGKEVDNFTFFDGTATFYCHRVYNTQGQLLYRIYQLAKLSHVSAERKSVYENYHITRYDMTCGWGKPVNDYEI